MRWFYSTRSHQIMTQAEKDKVIELFLSGKSVNHIVFLLDYEYNTDAVNEVVRERLRSLMHGTVA